MVWPGNGSSIKPAWYCRRVMRLARFAVAVGLLTRSAAAVAQSASPATIARLDPLIECKVAADPLKRLLHVAVSWPSGLKPRLPRDDSGIITERSFARIGVSRAPPERIEDNPEWANVCEREGCSLAYTVDFGKGVASDRRGDWGFEERQKIVVAPLVRWMVRPEDRRAKGRLRIDFDGGKNLELVSGVMDGRLNHIDTDLVMIDGPHVVLGQFTHKVIDVPGGRIDIALGPGDRGVADADLLAWIREGALDVISLLGRLPVPRLQVIVGRGGPYAIGSAVTMGMGGASIFVVVGDRTRKADLLRDWVMTHEMLHVAFPNMGFQRRWMEEGLSTYLEPILRARRGRYETWKMWGEFVRAMPQGLPKDGDRGLDRTNTWGRTYWGGALFWLHVDLEIRRRSKGARSLDDVLRALLNDGGNVTVRWDIPRLASVSEAATGTTALREAYDAWSAQAVTPDLGALWAALGVRAEKGDRVVFDDHAPDAEVRREMTTKALGNGITATRP